MRHFFTRLTRPKTYLSILLHVLLIFFLFLILYPFIAAFTSSFKTTKEMLVGATFLPENWQFNNYRDAWINANFAKYTFNSIWYAVLTSAMNGYAFARGEFVGKKLIFGIFSALMFVALGTSALYPSLRVMHFFHLDESLMGLVIRGFFAIHVADMYIVRGFVNSLPKELDEAATIDGCDFFGVFFRIILPLLKPVLATVAILSFSGAWNNYMWPMIVTMGNPESYPLAVGLRALQVSGTAAASWNLVLAGAMISAVPMLIFYMFFNKYFVKGLASGAVKG